jgi:hypothetical protein
VAVSLGLQDDTTSNYESNNKMSQQLEVQPVRFINAEPGILPFAGGQPVPVVLLSFGAEEGPIEDRAVGLVEARQMVMDILESLATMGDPLAQAIGQQFFSPKGESPEFDDGSQYDDGNCGDCGQ